MRTLALTLMAGSAAADPAFVQRPDAFPVEHVYTGGWEHFVGGGVAVFDCNGDARPDVDRPAADGVRAQRSRRGGKCVGRRGQSPCVRAKATPCPFAPHHTTDACRRPDRTRAAYRRTAGRGDGEVRSAS